jgi:DNA-binding CsgD family transcriptional regulator
MRQPGQPICSFSERESQILRLLNSGHDAKSVARTLDLSVHTVNERLRSARHKAGVSSSREAARLLAQQEGPKPVVYNAFGVAPDAASAVHGRLSGGRAAAFRQPRIGGWTGVVMISIALLGAAAMVARSNADAPRPLPPQPRVVATHPSPGATVPAGALTLSVTFDRPMLAGNYSFVRKDVSTYPDCGDNRPTQSADGRTFTLHCKVLPNRAYEIWFNSEPFMNFKGLDGSPAVPFQLKLTAR